MSGLSEGFDSSPQLPREGVLEMIKVQKDDTEQWVIVDEENEQVEAYIVMDGDEVDLVEIQPDGEEVEMWTGEVSPSEVNVVKVRIKSIFSYYKPQNGRKACIDVVEKLKENVAAEHEFVETNQL